MRCISKFSLFALLEIVRVESFRNACEAVHGKLSPGYVQCGEVSNDEIVVWVGE